MSIAMSYSVRTPMLIFPPVRDTSVDKSASTFRVLPYFAGYGSNVKPSSVLVVADPLHR